MRKFLLLSIGIFFTTVILAQTPGLIVKPAQSPGNGILDPNGDGYVSDTIDGGLQVGFTKPPDNDVTQSEIPYVAIIRPDPQPDILRGPAGGFIEIVGVDAAGNNAILTYNDGTNFLIRFRLGGYAPNSKSYSLLIDTDEAFGFTGENADDNALTGNPGFEVEIVLETNFNVKIYDIDGSNTGGSEVASYSYDTHCQKSIAISEAGGDPDFFYDFYVEFSDLTGLFDSSTPLRIVAVTTMNPHQAIGNNALSDVGGVTSGTNMDLIWEELIDGQTPTVPGDSVLDRTECPWINSPVTSSDGEIGGVLNGSGISYPVWVWVYQNGTKLDSVSVSSGTSWSVSGSYTLLQGDTITAVAKESGKGASYDNCDITYVSDNCPDALNKLYVPDDNNAKGICANAGAGISGATIRVYQLDGTEVVPGGTGSIAVEADGSFQWKCNTSNTGCTSGSPCLTSGQTYLVTQTVDGCESQPITYRVGSGSCTTSSTPTISTSTIIVSTQTLNGNGTSASSRIFIYKNDTVQIAAVNSNASSPFAWSADISDADLAECDEITAKQVETGKCISAATASISVTRQATNPSINSTGCYVSVPAFIDGFSTEIGATVTLYRVSPSATLGTATVGSEGTWSISPSPSPSIGQEIYAKISAGGCLTESNESAHVTLTSRTNISSYTFSFTTPIEGNDSVYGSISGGSYPVDVTLYVDEAEIGSGLTVNSAGNFYYTGLASYELSAGSTVKGTVTYGSQCESDYSSQSAVVDCIEPEDRTISRADSIICSGDLGIITVVNSESGVIYTPVLASDTTSCGYSKLGDGTDLDLSIDEPDTNPRYVRVKAVKYSPVQCETILSDSLAFYFIDAPSGSSPQTFCDTDNATVADLEPSGDSITWYDSDLGGSIVAKSTLLTDNTHYYATQTVNGCESENFLDVLVEVNTCNSAPNTNSENVSYPEDSTGIYINVLANDSDPDSDPITTKLILKQPSNGTASIVNDDSLSYQPTANWNGSDTIIYQVCDDQSPQNCAQDTVFITITAVNDAPTPQPDIVNYPEDSTGI
ncbi:MAG: cadherin-like domain-containing protein, partial [Prolixibacteraceae bacterium]|nr:cadherin-like domain-containing protein [Prolixibacteraceae bacterium]